MTTLMDLVAGNAEWPSGGLNRRLRIGANGAKLRIMIVHMGSEIL
jgi:hypothetical protein